jgi:hypothetical protein
MQLTQSEPSHRERSASLLFLDAASDPNSTHVRGLLFSYIERCCGGGGAGDSRFESALEFGSSYHK